MRTALLATALAGLVAPPSAHADDPKPSKTLLYTASDLPRLADGIDTPGPGLYAVRVWDSPRRHWSAGGSGGVVSLTAEVRKNTPGDARPTWQDAGKVELPASGKLKIEVKGARFDPPVFKGNYQAGKPTIETKPGTPMPAVFALTTNPDEDLDTALGLIRGRLDTTDPVSDARRTTVRTNHEGADFHPPATAAAWRERAEALREQLRVDLGLWPMPPKTPLNPQVFGKLDRDGYTIERVTLETLPGFVLAGNLYRPKGKAGRLPLVLCPHGHWADGRVNPEVQPRCVRWAKLGCVVFLYDMVGYNDSHAFGHAFLSPRLERWGFSLATLQTWNGLRALDWLTTLPDVDPERVACTGESGGGTQTFLLAALDDRVKAAAPVVMVSERFQGGCVCENAAGLRLGTDNVEIAALAAPRPMILVGATGDWTSRTLTRVHPVVREVYTLIGRPEDVEARTFDFPHNYNRTSREAVYKFLSPRLTGLDTPALSPADEEPIEAPETLRAFGPDHPEPPGLKSPAQLEAALVDTLGRQLDKLGPGVAAAPWQAGRALLATSHHVRTGLMNPTPASLEARVIREVGGADFKAVHLTVRRRASGEAVPVLHLIPSRGSSGTAVVMTSRGKADLVDPSGRLAPFVRALLDRGQAVVGFDPLLVGEAFDPARPAARRPETAHFATYNPSLAADRMQDLATIVAWARTLDGLQRVNLVGRAGAGPLALLARPRLEGIARTAIDLDGFDYADGSGPVPAGLDLPGVLQFGGLRAAAALTAPAPLAIANAGGAFDPAWARSAYALDDAAGMLQIDREPTDAAALARWLAPDRGQTTAP